MTVPKYYLAIVDVGHGSSAVLKTHKGTAVFDTGCGSALLEFLLQQGLRKLDLVILSHADRDHIGALAQLITCGYFQINCIYLNTDSEKRSDAWGDLLHELHCSMKKRIVKFKTSITTSENGQLDLPDAKLEILAPCPYLAARGPGSSDRRRRKITNNTVSAVIRIVSGGRPVALLPGDLDGLGLEYMVESKAKAKCPVLIFPHHGGLPGGSDPDKFARNILALALPKVVIFSIGRGAHANPDPSIVSVVRCHRATCRIMCTQLSEHCAEVLGKGGSNHLIDVFARGRENGVCCAGTILIDLSRPITVQPISRRHLAFIKKAAPSALCR